MRSPLVIVGATSSGKTDIVCNLAREMNGEVITGDKYHLIDGCPIGTGRADILSQHDVPKHLYGCLPHDFDPLQPEQYACSVQGVIEDIQSRNAVPIIELLFPEYLAELLKSVRVKVVGLRIANTANDIAARIRKRLTNALKFGLVEEAAQGLALGNEKNFVMNWWLYHILSSYVRSRLSMTDAIEFIVNTGTRKVMQSQSELLSLQAPVTWIDHDIHTPEQSLRTVLNTVLA